MNPLNKKISLVFETHPELTPDGLWGTIGDAEIELEPVTCKASIWSNVVLILQPPKPTFDKEIY